MTMKTSKIILQKITMKMKLTK